MNPSEIVVINQVSDRWGTTLYNNKQDANSTTHFYEGTNWGFTWFYTIKTQEV